MRSWPRRGGRAERSRGGILSSRAGDAGGADEAWAGLAGDPWPRGRGGGDRYRHGRCAAPTGPAFLLPVRHVGRVRIPGGARCDRAG